MKEGSGSQTPCLCPVVVIKTTSKMRIPNQLYLQPSTFEVHPEALRPDLSIIIVSWNTRDLLSRCLQSVADGEVNIPFRGGARPTSGSPTAEVFVVDNASSDGTAGMVREDYPWVQLIENRRNLGFARANNQAIKRSAGRYVLLLNPDTELDHAALFRLVDFMEERPEVGASGARIVNPDGTLQSSCYPFPTLSRELWRLFHLDRFNPYGSYDMSEWSLDQPRPVDAALGACLVVRRETLEEAGLLDEKYFLYSEEIDLCYRLRELGWVTFWNPHAVVKHFGGQSTKQVAPLMFRQLYESKVLFALKHFGQTPAAVYKLILSAAALPRLLLYPLAWMGNPAKKSERIALADNYLRLILRMPRLGVQTNSPGRLRSAKSRDHVAVLVSGPVRRSWLMEQSGYSTPRQDYFEIARRLGASLGGYDYSGAWYYLVRKLENRIRIDPLEAILYLRKFSDYDVVLSMSEKMALPTAALLRLRRANLPHVVIAHKLSSGLKTYLLPAWPIHRHFAHVICLCRAQAEYAISEMGLSPEKVDFVHDKVDHRFFQPQDEAVDDYILTVGAEQRDFQTLVEAVKETGRRLVVVASSPWSARKAILGSTENVEVLSQITYQQLKKVYAKARLVVVPLKNVDYAAGVNTLLESMAMAKPVIVSRTRGIQDYVIDGETGLFIEPRNSLALSQAIESVFESPPMQRYLGHNARQAVEREMNLDIYADRVAQIIRKVAKGVSPGYRG